jgi:hypothetical protein
MRILKYFGYVLFLIINIFIIELILRAFDPEQVMVKSFDSQKLFTMYPKRSGIVISEEYKVQVDLNETGYRQELNSEYKYPILALGDSFTEGWGVNGNENYIEVANRQLDSNHKIRNLGIHGASPVFYLLQLPILLEEYKPKTIILQLFDNDIDDNEKLIQFMVEKDGSFYPKPDKSVVILGENLSNSIKESSLYRLIKKIVLVVKGIPSPILYYKIDKVPAINQLSHQESLDKYGRLEALGDAIDTRYNGQFGFYNSSKKFPWEERFILHRKYLDKIMEICKKENVELRILYIPAKEFFAQDGILGKTPITNYSIEAKMNPHLQEILQFCEANKLICYNTGELFYSKTPENLYFPYDAHWNSQGHQEFGEILGRAFKNRK